MHYSGILVVTDPRAVTDCARDVDALPGVEVHYCHPESGRIIAVQESATAAEQEAGLRRIQALSRVRLTALVEHRVDDEGEA